MTTWTVIPGGGGDYTNLAAALSNASTVAGDIIEISGDWTSTTDTTAATVADNNITIRAASGDQAEHDGLDNGTTNYELAVTSGHCITVNNTGCVIEGIIIKQDGTVTSAEGIRMAASSGTLTLRRLIIWADTQDSQQDGVHCGNLSCTIIIEQTYIFGFYRAGILAQAFTAGTPTVTFDINSCGFWDNGHNTSAAAGQQGGGVVVHANGGAGSNFTVNIHNTWALENDPGSTSLNSDYHQEGSTGTIAWNISYSADSDNSIAGVDGTGAGNLASRVIGESTAGGDEILVTDITSAPFDLTLVDDATNNDAQDAHAVGTAETLTIPSTDIAGTSRPENTNYDIGPFEIVAAVGGANPKGPLGMPLHGPFGGPI